MSKTFVMGYFIFWNTCSYSGKNVYFGKQIGSGKQYSVNCWLVVAVKIWKFEQVCMESWLKNTLTSLINKIAPYFIILKLVSNCVYIRAVDPISK